MMQGPRFDCPPHVQALLPATYIMKNQFWGVLGRSIVTDTMIGSSCVQAVASFFSHGTRGAPFNLEISWCQFWSFYHDVVERTWCELRSRATKEINKIYYLLDIYEKDDELTQGLQAQPCFSTEKVALLHGDNNSTRKNCSAF